MSFSRSSRFPMYKRDSTPGPGSYDIQWGAIGYDSYKFKLYSAARFPEYRNNHKGSREGSMSNVTVMRNPSSIKTSANIPLTAHSVQGKVSRRTPLVAAETRKGQRNPFYAKENNIIENRMGNVVKTKTTRSVGRQLGISSQLLYNAEQQVSFKSTQANSTRVGLSVTSQNHELGYSNLLQLRYKLLPQLETKFKFEDRHTSLEPSPNTITHNEFKIVNSEFSEEKLVNHRSDQRTARRRWKKPPTNCEFQCKNGVFKSVKKQTFSWCDTKFKFRRNNNSNVTEDAGVKMKKSEFGVSNTKNIRESECSARKQLISDECALNSCGNCTLHGTTCDMYWRRVYILKSMRLLEKSLLQQESKTGKILNLLSVLKQEAGNLCKTV